MWDSASCGAKSNGHKCKMTRSKPSGEWNITICVLLLLILCGDVHPNPGPQGPGKTLSLCHINARSLMSIDTETQSYLKFDEIESRLVNELEFDVICVSESWLDNSILDIHIPNYSVFRKDRNRHGGGVLIYVTDSLSAVRRLDLEHIDVESVWIEVDISGKKVILASYYRPPLSQGQRVQVVDNFITLFQASVVNAMMERADCLMIVGDFNDRCQSWEGSHNTSDLGTKLLDLTNLLNLFQIISEPTRYTEHTSSILDIILTDSPGLVNNLAVTPPFSDLDHCTISCSVEFHHSINNVFYRKVWDYNQANYQGLNDSLNAELINWENQMGQDIEENAMILNTIITENADMYIPNRIIKIRTRDKPYMTHACRIADRDRDRWHKKFQRTRQQNHYDIFREKRRFAKLTRQTAKNEYQLRLNMRLTNANTSPRDYWKLVKSIKGAKVKSDIGTIKDNGAYVTNNGDKAAVFNTYFSSQSTIDQTPAALPPLYYSTPSRLYDIITTPDEVSCIIRSLDPAKASGPDGIGSRIIKNTCLSIKHTTSRLFNQSFEQGKVPSMWKMANVTPIYKKGDRQLVNNYRPVSLLPVIGKIQERIVFKTLYN